MNIDATELSPVQFETNWLIIVVQQDTEVSADVLPDDHPLRSALESAMERGDFSAKAEELLTFYQASGTAADNVVLAGVGRSSEWDLRCLRHTLLAALRTCCVNSDQSVAVTVDDCINEKLGTTAIAELFADCVTTAPVDADLYKAEKSRSAFACATLLLSNVDAAVQDSLTAGAAIGEAANLVKELVNRTGADVNPESFCQTCQRPGG